MDSDKAKNLRENLKRTYLKTSEKMLKKNKNKVLFLKSKYRVMKHRTLPTQIERYNTSKYLNVTRNHPEKNTKSQKNSQNNKTQKKSSKQQNPNKK